MIYRDIERVISSKSKIDDRITPDYKEYCLSNIPSTIMNHFQVNNNRQSLPDETFKDELDGSENIILLLVDGLGYKNWLKHHKNTRFLKKLSEKGSTTPLTSVFPSTTSASLNTLNSGLTPQEHGLPEWFVYFQEIDMTLQSLRLQTVEGIDVGDFEIDNVDSNILFKDETIYEKLEKNGIPSYTLAREALIDNPYQRLTLKGSKRLPYQNLDDLFNKIRTLTETQKGPTFIYAYIDSLDAVGHVCGPSSIEYADELEKIDCAVINGLISKISRKNASDTCIIVTADHGMIDIPANSTMYLNSLPEFQSMLRESSNMGYIAPTGSPRDVYLHLKKDSVDDCFHYLSEELVGFADVFRVKEAIELGLYGVGRPCDEFLDRVGDLLLLPRENWTLWYQVFPAKLYEKAGVHGGLSKEEMLIPFGVSKLSELLN
ncbi:alkaline phosphatase family protein [Thermoproteota archaeon]